MIPHQVVLISDTGLILDWHTIIIITLFQCYINRSEPLHFKCVCRIGVRCIFSIVIEDLFMNLSTKNSLSFQRSCFILFLGTM